MPVRVDPDLPAALECSVGPCRVSVRSAVRQPVLEAALAAAAAAVEAAPGTSQVRWRYVETWVGEVAVALDGGDGRAAAVMEAIVAGLGRAGVRDADLLAVGGVPAPTAPAEPMPEGQGRSRC